MIFGWDISTSIIGVTVLDSEGKYVTASHLDLRKAEGMMTKGDQARAFVNLIVDRYGLDPNMHFIEDRLANFSFGKTMMQTLMTLAAFNTLVSWYIHTRDPAPAHITHIHPSTVKAIMKREGLVIPKGADKKQLTLDFVRKNVPGWIVDLNRNEKPQPWNFDRADSYIIARSGYLRDYLKGATGQEAQGAAGQPGSGADSEG